MTIEELPYNHENTTKTKEKVSINPIGVSNPQTDPFRDPPLEHQLQNYETAEKIVDELQERSGIPIKGWSRGILVTMASLHTDRRNGFIAPTIKELRNRLNAKKVKIDGKLTGYNNMRKQIKYLHKKGLIIRLPERKGHGYQYVLANMQDRIPVKRRTPSYLEEKDDILIQNTLYRTIFKSSREEERGEKEESSESSDNNNEPEPEPEFHHISMKSKLNSIQIEEELLHEDYERLKSNPNWILSSPQNKGLKYEKRISPHRKYTITVYPKDGTVTMMIGCSEDPFRWYPRDDWINLLGICGSILRELQDSLGVSQPLIHSNITDWSVTQLHIGYDYKMNAYGGIERGKQSKKLEIARMFNGSVKVKHLVGVICQVYNKKLPYKGDVIRAEAQYNFPSSYFSSSSYFTGDDDNPPLSPPPPPTLASLKDRIKPILSMEEILNIIYSSK